jgi:heme exporter protein D
MNWGSFGEFLAMGGYGLYVWGSYVITFLLIALELVLLDRRHRNAKQRLVKASR